MANRKGPMGKGTSVKEKAGKVARAKAARDAALDTIAAAPPEFDPTDPKVKEEQRKQRRQQALDLEQETIDRMAKSAKSPNGQIRKAKMVAAVMALRMQGMKRGEIAGHLGINPMTVSKLLQSIRKNHEASAQLLRLDQIGIPLAIDNVLTGLEEGDKDYTQDLMKGRGLYRTHKSIDAQVTKTVLEMKIIVTDPRPEMIAGSAPARPGSIVGSPMTIDAVTVPEKALPAPVGVGAPELP